MKLLILLILSITIPCCAAGFLWYCCCVAPVELLLHLQHNLCKIVFALLYLIGAYCLYFWRLVVLLLCRSGSALTAIFCWWFHFCKHNLCKIAFVFGTHFFPIRVRNFTFAGIELILLPCRKWKSCPRGVSGWRGLSEKGLFSFYPQIKILASLTFHLFIHLT